MSSELYKLLFVEYIISYPIFYQASFTSLLLNSYHLYLAVLRVPFNFRDIRLKHFRNLKVCLQSLREKRFGYAGV